jgi:HEAT repeat protein
MTAALPSLSDRRHFERLAEYLNATPQADLEPIRSMLTLFGPTAITPITAMLGSLEHRPARMMVCDFLATHGRDTVDLIGGFIYDKRWFVARNVAMILGEIGHERGLSFLRKSAAHADPRVRLETLRALKRIGAPEAERIMQGFLKDPDGDLRKRALKALGQTGSAAALEELKSQIDSASLPDRDPRELRELLFAYGRLGGSEAAETLIRFAHKAPLLKSRRWAPVRAAAAWALGASSEPRARAELEILARDGATDVSQAARSALAIRNKGSVLQSGANDPDEDEEP